MTWEKFCEVFRISFTKEIQKDQIIFVLHCGKFGMKEVFGISTIYYEKMCMEESFVDTKLLAHMYRTGNMSKYLGIDVEIDINKEIKPEII